jgi:hypothetical protein
VRCVGTLRRGSQIFWARTSKDGAHDVEIVHFSFLEVTVAATRVVEGVEGVPPVVREMSVVRIAEETAHFLVLLLKAGVFLLELTNLDQRGREGGDLVWGEAESGLEFCDGLFELSRRGMSGRVGGAFWDAELEASPRRRPRTCSM